VSEVVFIIKHKKKKHFEETNLSVQLFYYKMAGRPTEFSEESVRQFMLANGGRVTNHELVKHFKSW
jgi:hypothetical protein